MKKLITKDLRQIELLKLGAPQIFVENIGKIEELKYRVENVDGAYFYLPTLSEYKILENLNIIPLFDEGNNFCVVAYNDNVKKIIRFELENDKIYKDYGFNWQLLFFDIMFQYFEDQIDDHLSIVKFISVGNKIGFQYSDRLFHLLNLPVEEYNIKYENVEIWKKEIAKELKI